MSWVNEYLELIKEAQQMIKQSEHSIKILEQEEIRNRRFEINIGRKSLKLIEKRLKDVILKRKSYRELMNEKLQSLEFPTF